MEQSQLEKLPPGWSHLSTVFGLYNLVHDLVPNSVLEIGSFLGKSAVTIRFAAPHAKITCVDTWNNSFIRAQTFNDFNVSVSDLYNAFKYYVAPYDIASMQGDIRDTSIQNMLDESYDLVHIDVHRAPEVFIPTLEYAWSVATIAVSGAHFNNDYIKSTVIEFAQSKNLLVHNTDSIWYLIK
jgi:predicted O-methyltransferase YrrM